MLVRCHWLYHIFYINIRTFHCCICIATSSQLCEDECVCVCARVRVCVRVVLHDCDCGGKAFYCCIYEAKTWDFCVYDGYYYFMFLQKTFKRIYTLMVIQIVSYTNNYQLYSAY